MSRAECCEIYENLIAAGFISRKNTVKCPFKKGCPQTEDACRLGDALVAIDQDSKDAAITPEDLAQSKALAKLEAQANARKTRPASMEDIQFENKQHTLTSISRVN